MIKISAIVLAVLVHAAAFAQPNVTGGFGNMTTDSTYTVTGTGFGVKTTAGPLLYDYLTNNLDVYTPAGIEQDELVPAGAGLPWKSQSAASACYADLDNGRVPGRGSMYSLPKGGMNSWDYELDKGYELPQIYINWWYRYPSTAAEDAGYPDSDLWATRFWWDASSSKLYRASSIYGNGTVPCDDTYVILWRAGAWASWCNPSQACNKNTYTNKSLLFPPNRWLHIEAVMDSRDLDGCESHLGYAVSWVDNQILNDDATSTDKHWFLNDGRIYGGPSNLSKIENFGFDPHTTSDTYLDIPWSTEGDTCRYTEVYIDSTRARVVIADDPVYENASHTEIQIPTAWDGPGGEITFTANTGTFATDDIVYVFVINTDGVVSTGTLAATVGTEYSAPYTPGQPGAPTNLRATESD